MKVVVAAFNQEKALVGAFSVITNLRMELFEALLGTPDMGHCVLSRVQLMGAAGGDWVAVMVTDHNEGLLALKSAICCSFNCLSEQIDLRLVCRHQGRARTC